MESLLHDHKITLELNQVFQLILDHLCNENEKYLNFYIKIPAHLFVTTLILMMEEVICFFDFGNFNVNVVDLLIQIAVDVLNLDIYIIQDNEGIVQILKIPSGNFTKKVYLKYMHDNKYVGTNHHVPLIKKKKLCATKPCPSGFIVILGEESSQDVPKDLSMFQVERDQDFDEQPSLPENIITPEHSYCKSPQYTVDECHEDIQNHIEDETQSDLNEDTEQESQIPVYNESLYEVSGNSENEEANEEFEPPVPLINSGKPFPTHLFDNLQPIEVNSIPKDICHATGMEEHPKVTLDIQCLRRGGGVALTSTIN